MQIKKSFRKSGEHRKECRLWQGNLTVLSIYETTEGSVGKRGWHKLTLAMGRVCNTKAKRNVHKHCILASKFLSHEHTD